MIWQFFIDFFIPNRRNDYRAKILQLPFLIGLVFLFFLTKSSLSLFALNQPAVLGYSSQITPERIIELTNQERQKFDLSSLSVNPLLSEAAQQKAADMFAFNYWAHTSPTGRDPWSFLKIVDYDYIYAGENLARDFASSESVVAAWMESPSHKKNIIDDNYQEIGVAVVNGTLEGVKTTLVVQLFGSSVQGITEGKKAAMIPQETTSVVDLAGVSGEEGIVVPPIDPGQIIRYAGIFILGILLGGLIVDKLIIEKKGVARLRGDNVAHIGFLAVILLMVLLFKSGTIL